MQVVSYNRQFQLLGKKSFSPYPLQGHSWDFFLLGRGGVTKPEYLLDFHVKICAVLS